jgi:hypothetical protein
MNRINECKFKHEVYEKLDDLLGSIGKDVFVNILYPEIKDNPNVTTKEISERNSRFSEFSSQESRLSSAKSIFRDGLEKEAFHLIIGSKRLRPETIKKAEEFLKQISTSIS